MLCSILSLRAQTFVKPAVKVKDTSFAVITDKGTFQACEAELKAYQEILGMEGLPPTMQKQDTINAVQQLPICSEVSLQL